MITKISTLVMMCCSAIAFAQKSTDLFTQDFNKSKNLTLVRTNLLIPLVLNEKNVFISNLSYQIAKTDLSLKETNLALGLKHQFKNNWNVNILLLTRNRTTGDFSGKDSWQMGAISIAEKKYSDSLKLNFGAYVNNELFGPFVVPILGVYWKPNNKIELNCKLPLKLKAMYALNQKNSLGIYYKGIVSSYFSQSVASTNNKYQSFAYNEVAALYEFEPIKSFIFQFKAGYFLGTNLYTYTIDQKLPLTLSVFKFNDRRTLTSNSKLNSPYIGISFIYRVYHD